MGGLKWRLCYKKSRVLASARMPPLVFCGRSSQKLFNSIKKLLISSTTHINSKILYDYITFYDSIKTCSHLLRHSSVGWQPGQRPQYSPGERKWPLDFGRSLKEKVERYKPNLRVVVSPVKDKVSARTSFQSFTSQCFLFPLHLKSKTWGKILRLNYWRRRRILNIKNEKSLTP